MRDELLARIDQRLEKLNLSESRAALNAGLGKDAIRNIRRAVQRGDIRGSVNATTLAMLAPVLKTSAAWLAGEDVPEEGGPPATIAAPLLSWVSAGQLVQPDVPIYERPDIILTEQGLDPAGDWIALRVEGDSMEPDIAA